MILALYYLRTCLNDTESPLTTVESMLRVAFAFYTMVTRFSKVAITQATVTSSRPKILVLTGPTAVGKSATALELCKQVDGEVISADSVQVYCHLDIGSNKATAAERATVPHHMLDIADPSSDDFTAGNFFRAARAAVEDVLTRGGVPVVVGGTMMYVRWFVYGPPATPKAPEEARARMEEALKEVDGDWDKGIALLAQRDPKRAQVLLRNDWYRLKRALEVLETTGVAMTDMPLQGAAPGTERESQLDYDFRCVFLYGDRIRLNRCIDERCEQMIFAVDGEQERRKSIFREVCDLLKTRGLRVAPSAPSRAIGYRQTISYLVDRALAVRDGEMALEGSAEKARIDAFRTYISEFQSATRGYAKQQLAWFRKDKRFQWLKFRGQDTVNAVKGMLDMSEEEYNTFVEETEQSQEAIREDIIMQGKDMKRYVTRKRWLEEDSMTEMNAIALAEECAQELVVTLGVEELRRIQEIIRRKG